MAMATIMAYLSEFEEIKTNILYGLQPVFMYENFSAKNI